MGSCELACVFDGALNIGKDAIGDMSKLKLWRAIRNCIINYLILSNESDKITYVQLRYFFIKSNFHSLVQNLDVYLNSCR